jgi:hypothetical protein
VAIVNGYTTLASFKLFAIPQGGVDAADDTVIEDLITAASRFIDAKTGRTFYSRAETRYYDVPRSQNNRRELWLDDDLISVTTLTNGDGTVIAAADYYLLPRNSTPKFSVVLKRSSYSVYWRGDDDYDPEGAIELEGVWGYSATAPADITQACNWIALSAYKRRFGENLSERSVVTNSGVIVTPEDIPSIAWEIVRRYKRLV